MKFPLDYDLFVEICASRQSGVQSGQLCGVFGAMERFGCLPACCWQVSVDRLCEQGEIMFP